jgi:hypothetical protein
MPFELLACTVSVTITTKVAVETVASFILVLADELPVLVVLEMPKSSNASNAGMNADLIHPPPLFVEFVMRQSLWVELSQQQRMLVSPVLRHGV